MAPEVNRLAGLPSNYVVFTEPTMQQLGYYWGNRQDQATGHSAAGDCCGVQAWQTGRNGPSGGWFGLVLA